MHVMENLNWNSEDAISKTPKRLLTWGFVLVDAETEYETLPLIVRERLQIKKHQYPKTEREKLEYWLRLKNLVIHYCNRLASQYGVDPEDSIQEAYLFYEKLLSQFRPLYRRKRLSDGTDDAETLYKLYTTDENNIEWVWNFFEFRPYMCKGLYNKLRHFTQQTAKKQKRFQTFSEFEGETGVLSFDNAVYHFSSDKKELNSFLDVERSLLNDSLKTIVDDVITQLSSTRKQVATYFFKRGLLETDICKLVNKSPGTVNAHISAIRKEMRTHPKVVSLFQEFNDLGVKNLNIYEC